jgi:hypothetical protein
MLNDCPIYCGSTYHDRTNPSHVVKVDEVGSEYHATDENRIVIFYLGTGHVARPFYLSTQRFREMFQIVEQAK